MNGEDTVVADAQEAVVSKLPTSLSSDSRKHLGELIKLTTEQEARLKKFLKENIKNWLDDTSDLHRRLQDDNDLVEGIIMETDFPWVGCSNVHIPVTEIYMDGYRSIIKRSILGAGLIWVAESDDENLELAANAEEMLNFKARNEWNVEHCIDGVIWTTCRDGLGIIQCTWAEEYEKIHDIILLANEEDFMAELPTPQDSGMSEEEWFALLGMVKQQASDEFPIEVPVTVEKVTYRGCKGEIVDAVDFVTFPASTMDIKSPACRGYGKNFNYHIEVIRQKSEEGVFYKDAATTVIESNKQAAPNSYVQAKDEIMGISRANNKDERNLYELVVKGRLDDNSEPGKYLVTYSYDSDELLGCMDYIYRTDFYSLFRIDERPNQLFGKNIPAKTRDINDLIDTSINSEINTRTISTVPIFKAQKDLKDELDPELQANKIRPGMILWLSNFDAVDQFKIQPTDLGENAQLQERSMRILDMHMGMPASLFAGGVPAGDPQAPGNKTTALINQGNLRMEDPISCFRYGIEELGNICLSHVYQFDSSIIDFKSQDESQGQMVKKTIQKKLLRKGIHLKMNGVTVLDNPDFEMQKHFQLLQQLETLVPTFAQNPALSAEVARDAMRKGRISGRDRYLPSDEELQAQQVEIQKQAMGQMVAEKAAADQKAKEDMVKANLAKIQQGMQIRSTANKVAEEKLGLNGDQPSEPANAQGGNV